MGNCTSNKYFSEISPMEEDEEAVDTVKRRLIPDNDGNGALRSSSPATTEVKIRITKRELEKLLSKVDAEKLPVTELLSRLIDVGDAFESTHRGSWRPSLQTIPELN